MASVIKDNCTNCKICEPVCPTGAIRPGNTRFKIDSDTCIDCRQCIPVCPVAAIRPVAKLVKKNAS